MRKGKERWEDAEQAESYALFGLVILAKNGVIYNASFSEGVERGFITDYTSFCAYYSTSIPPDARTEDCIGQPREMQEMKGSQPLIKDLEPSMGSQTGPGYLYHELLLIAIANQTLIKLMTTFRTSNLKQVSKLSSLLKSVKNYTFNQFKSATGKGMDLSSTEKYDLSQLMFTDEKQKLQTQVIALNIIYFWARHGVIKIDASASSKSKNMYWDIDRID